MKVADLMQTKVISVRGDEPLSEAVRLLAEGHVSGLPVVDPAGRVIGVLSSADILQAEAESGGPGELERNGALVEDVMTRRPLMIAPEAELHEAAQQMLYGEVHRLFVESEGKLVGVISQSDIVRAVAGGLLIKPVEAGPVTPKKPAPGSGKNRKKKSAARAPKAKRR